MVDPHPVRFFAQYPEPFLPPAPAVLSHGIPPVQGIPPHLALGAEIIRGHPGHFRRIAVPVQLEIFPVGPHIGAVRSHEKGHVSQEGDAPVPGCPADLPPCLEEHILPSGARVTSSASSRPALASFRIPFLQDFRPLLPGLSSILLPDGLEQGIVLQPVLLSPAEHSKFRIIRPGQGKSSGQQFFLSGKSRKGEIGRIPQARRIQGQDLPDLLAGGWRKSRNRMADPRISRPVSPGREVGWSSTPAPRSIRGRSGGRAFFSRHR